MCLLRDDLSPRWTTADGTRPVDGRGEIIITPERARVVTVAKGRYDLPNLYVAHRGGRIGQDCFGWSNSLSVPIGPVGTQFLFLLHQYERNDGIPFEGDRRYRFYELSRIYPVSPDGLNTIGPERDIMGYRKDDPPRTLTVAEALAEIAALVGNAATPTPR